MGELEDRLKRLAEHRAAQIQAFAMPPTDELAVRRRVTRRDRRGRRHRGVSGGCTGARRSAPVLPEQQRTHSGNARRTRSRRDRQDGQARLHLPPDRRRRAEQERGQGLPGAHRPCQRGGRRQRPQDRGRVPRRPVVGRQPDRGGRPRAEPQGVRGRERLAVRVRVLQVPAESGRPDGGGWLRRHLLRREGQRVRVVGAGERGALPRPRLRQRHRDHAPARRHEERRDRLRRRPVGGRVGRQHPELRRARPGAHSRSTATPRSTSTPPTSGTSSSASRTRAPTPRTSGCWRRATSPCSRGFSRTA